MIQTIKEFPGVINLRRMLFEKKFSSHKNVNYFRGVFKSFNEARLSAPGTKPVGYNNIDSARLYKERTERIYSTDYPVLYWMKNLSEQFETVFDFGGHVGIHYYTYSKFIDFNSIYTWTVCDVESVTTEGKILAVHKKAEKLNFVNNINSADGHDLFLANGSLQYLEWELHDKLRAMKSPPKIVIVNMLPLHESLRTITLQSIGTSFCPYLIRKESNFIKGMQDFGYTLIDRWNNEEKSCHIAFEPERSLRHYKGMIFIK